MARKRRGRGKGALDKYKIVEYVRRFSQHFGYSPTYREIMAAKCIHSTSHVKFLIDGLIAAGKLGRFDKGRARTLFIPDDLKRIAAMERMIYQYVRSTDVIGSADESLYDEIVVKVGQRLQAERSQEKEAVYDEVD